MLTGFSSTPLHKAAFTGREMAMRYLIKKGAKVDAKDNEGATPLHKAAFSGEVKAVTLVCSDPPAHSWLVHSLTRTAVDQQGRYCQWKGQARLYSIAQCCFQRQRWRRHSSGWAKCYCWHSWCEWLEVRLLRSYWLGLTIRTRPIHHAASNGHAQVIDILLKANLSGILCVDNNGITPLMNAAYNGHVDCIKYVRRLFFSWGAQLTRSLVCWSSLALRSKSEITTEQLVCTTRPLVPSSDRLSRACWVTALTSTSRTKRYVHSNTRHLSGSEPNVMLTGSYSFALCRRRWWPRRCQLVVS